MNGNVQPTPPPHSHTCPCDAEKGKGKGEETSGQSVSHFEKIEKPQKQIYCGQKSSLGFFGVAVGKESVENDRQNKEQKGFADCFFSALSLLFYRKLCFRRFEVFITTGFLLTSPQNLIMFTYKRCISKVINISL